MTPVAIHLPILRLALAMAALGMAVSPAIAQQRQGVTYDRTQKGYRITRTLPDGGKSISEIPSAGQALTEFKQRTRGERSQAGTGADAVTVYLVHSKEFPKNTVDSVLVGLEQLALAADDQSVRTAAASSLAGSGDPRLMSPLAGSLNRALRVYRQSRDPMVRAVMLPRLAFYEERSRVIGFLKSVAEQDASGEDFPDAPAHAVTALSYMGEEGRVALRQLFESKKVSHARAGAFLHYLSQRGFREASR